MEFYALLSTDNQVITQLFPLWFSTPKSLKDSIPFIQALRTKRICSESSEVIRHFKDLKIGFIKQGYKPELLDYHLERAMRVDQKALLQTKE